MTHLGGVLPVLTTAFGEDGGLDTAAIAREIDWLFDCGVHGVTVAMVSEYLRLTDSERNLLADTVLESVAGRGHVVMSAGSESTHESARAAARYSQSGVRAVMVNPPLSVSAGEGELTDHYRRIADAAGSASVIVQDASGYVGRPLSLDFLAKLLDEYGPEKVQFKPESEPLGLRLTELLKLTGGRARVFEGSGGRNLVDSFRRGVVGTMPGSDMVWAIVDLWNALRGADDDRAYALQERIVPLLGYSTSLDSYIAVEKFILRELGVLHSVRQRGPLAFELDAIARTEITEMLARLAKLSTSLPAAGTHPRP